MNRTVLLKTPEFRKPLLRLLLFQLAVIVAAGLLMALQLKETARRSDDRLAALVSRTIREYPMAKEAAVRLLTGNTVPEEIREGRELLGLYGYDSGVALRNRPVYRGMDTRILLSLLGLGIFSIPGMYLVYRRFRLKQLEHLASLMDSAGQILSEDFRDLPGAEQEGLWSSLVFRYNQMVRKLRASSARLEGDRNFLREVLSDISHQLKTPMSALFLYTDLMTRDPEMPRELREEFLGHCSSALNRMDRLIRNLLKLARMEAGAIDFRQVPVDLHPFLEGIFRDLEHRRQERSLEIRAEEGPCLLSADPLWLGEVFSNLLVNAIQHTPPDGHILVTLSRSPLFLRVTVEDDGEGIPPEDLPRIFEKFFRGSRPAGEDSAGIGLSLCRSIIRSLNGEIRVSGRPGGGTVFTLTFPYDSVSQGSPPVKSGAPG